LGVKNVVEEIVSREYEKMRPTMSGFCGCEVCHDDVMVYALNRVKPRYVSQLMGEVVTNVAMGKDQAVADITVGLVEGFRRVTASPRPGVTHHKT
jgi:competence protein ComFB